jgi:hypothetical protein
MGSNSLGTIIRMNMWKLRVPNTMLVVAAFFCFADITYAPKNSDPGPLVSAVLGILLLRRALYANPPLMVIIPGYFLAALVVAGNHGLLHGSILVWVVLMLVGFACFALFERKRIERIKACFKRGQAT